MSATESTERHTKYPKIVKNRIAARDDSKSEASNKAKLAEVLKAKRILERLKLDK